MSDNRFLRVFIACILPLVAMVASCTETSSVETTSKLNVVNFDENMQPEYKNFKTFYIAFSDAMHRNDWISIAELTSFPFVISGELDSEGSVVFDQHGFVKSIGGILKEEIYVNINDELQVTNYRKVISDSANHVRVSDNEAQLFGMSFVNTANGWKLSRVSTHAHIVEKYAGGIQ